MIKLAVIFALFLQTTRQEGCNINHFRTWDPVVLSSTTYQVLYPPIENPPTNRNFTVLTDDTIIISCNGGYFQYPDQKPATTTILATCNQDSQLEVEDKILDFDKLDCINFKPMTAKVTTTRCGPNSVIIEVGFQVGLNIRFIPQVRICFDLVNLVPVYANYNLTKSIGFIKSYLVTRYIVDSVYNLTIDFDNLYSNWDYQRQTINKLLGLPENSTKYVNPTSCSPNPGATTPGFCFSLRPLTYRGDFVYLSQQYATYRYINVAPQWYFIDYNLEKLEYNVVDYVKGKMDVEVYTGTYGVATLPHSTTNEEVELFLYVSGTVKAIPVPLLFWKLVYDPQTLRATVFLIVNDPYQKDAAKNAICDDISDQITWLTWEKRNVTKGYSYACSYEDVRAKIAYLPQILVRHNLI